MDPVEGKVPRGDGRKDIVEVVRGGAASAGGLATIPIGVAGVGVAAGAGRRPRLVGRGRGDVRVPDYAIHASLRGVLIGGKQRHSLEYLRSTRKEVKNEMLFYPPFFLFFLSKVE